MSLLSIETELKAEFQKESEKILERFSGVEKRFSLSPNSNDYKMAFKEVKRATAGTGRIITMLRVNANPADSYLYWVLAKRKSAMGGSYVIWGYNASLHGLNEGSYDLKFQEALGMLYGHYVRR